MHQPKVLVLSGSTRSGSLNSQLVALAAKKLALSDAEVSHISLADYPLPIYDGDLEAEKGVPENARKLATLFENHHAVFISTPEYNAGVPPVLKNAIDWVSRVSKPGGGRTQAFSKPAFALGSVSPGGFGGIRNLISFRTVLEVGLGARVLPQMIIVARASDAFDDKGDLKDDGLMSQLDTVLSGLMAAGKQVHLD